MRRLVVLGAVLALVGCGKHEEKQKPVPAVAPKTAAPSKQWLVIFKDPDVWMSVNTKVDTVKGLKRVWYGTVRSSSPNQPVISNSLSEYDCANRSQRTLQEFGYDKDSKPVKFEVPDKPQWSYPPPETISYGVMNWACDSTELKGKGSYDRLEDARAALLQAKTESKK